MENHGLQLSIDAGLVECAERLHAACLRRDAAGDPIVDILYSHARQYLHGVCTLMAMHLNETRDLPVLLLEGRRIGSDRWTMRHAAVLVEPDTPDLYRSCILDAAGGGTFVERLPMYQEPLWEYRVVLAEDSDNPFSRRMASPREPKADIEDHVRALPGLSLALGIEYDLRASLRWIIANAGTEGHLDAAAKDQVIEMMNRENHPAP